MSRRRSRAAERNLKLVTDLRRDYGMFNCPRCHLDSAQTYTDYVVTSDLKKYPWLKPWYGEKLCRSCTHPSIHEEDKERARLHDNDQQQLAASIIVNHNRQNRRRAGFSKASSHDPVGTAGHLPFRKPTLEPPDDPLLATKGRKKGDK